MEPSPSLRNRKSPIELNQPASERPEKGRTKKRTAVVDDDDQISAGISALDIFRVISGVLLLSCLLSWFVTDGESITWGYRPNISRWRTLKALFQPAVNLTDTELALYNGEDPTRPIYVAVNGSVFDVTANPSTYGPGGGYSFFAGRDAARAFVSGCFQDDLDWDLRGIEEMFIAGVERARDERDVGEIVGLETMLKNREVGGEEKMTKEGRLRWLHNRRMKRREVAMEQVNEQIDHWDKFFRNHDKYFYVGRVVHPSTEGKPIPKRCKSGGAKPS